MRTALKLKFSFFWLAFFLISFYAHADKIDSLISVLEKTEEITDKVHILNQLSEEYKYKDIYVSYQYARQALDLSLKKNILKEIPVAYNRIGYYYSVIGKSDSAIFCFNEALKLYIKANNKRGIANTYNFLGIAYKMINPAQSIAYYQKAFAIQQELKLYNEAASSLSNIGVVFLLNEKYDTALIYLFEAIHYDSLSSDSLNIAHSLNAIGNVYYQKGIYSKSLEYYLEALQIFERNKWDDAISKMLNNIAGIYENLKDYNKALDYYKQSVELKKKLNNKTGMANTNCQIAYIYYIQGKTKDALELIEDCIKIYNDTDDNEGLMIAYIMQGKLFLNLRKIDESETIIRKALQLATIAKSQQSMAECFQYLGRIYNYQKKNSEAIRYYKQGIAIAQVTGIPDLERGLYKDLASAYSENKQFKLANLALTKYIELNDSITNMENRRILLDLQTRYETSKKEHELEMAKKDKIIQGLIINQQKVEIKKQKGFSNALIVYALLTMVILYLIFNNGVRQLKVKSRKV
jgi:tetratricopeptide (TPR) repeat protein